MGKLLAILLTGVVFFMMSGCNFGKTASIAYNEIVGDTRESVSSVSLSDLSQGYAVTYTPLDGGEFGEFTISYCNGRVEKIDTIVAAPIVGKWGQFQIDGNNVHLDLYYQLPGNEEFIHDEMNFVVTEGAFTVGVQVGGRVVSSIKVNPCDESDHEH